MADPKDEFDPFEDPEVEGLGDTGGDFDPFEDPEVMETPDPEPRSAGEDALLGLVDGLLLNNAGELGNMGAELGAALAPTPALPRASARGLDAPLSPDQGPGTDMEALYALARESPAGKLAHGAGLVGTGALGSAVAGPSVAAQAGMGALMGGYSSGGDSGYDPVSTAVGAGGGAALGTAGALAGKGAGKIQELLRARMGAAPKPVPNPSGGFSYPKPPTNFERMLEASKIDATKGPKSGFLWPLAGQATAHALNAATSPAAQSLYRGAGGVTAAAAPQSVSGLFGGSARAQDAPMSVEIGEAVPWDTTQVPSIGDAYLTGDPVVDIGEAQMRDPLNVEIGEAEVKAYAGMPTLSWSLQSVLTSGATGLPPDAEQRLTEAVMSGDDQRVIAANFRLQQKYPAYAKRLREELEALNEE